MSLSCQWPHDGLAEGLSEAEVNMDDSVHVPSDTFSTLPCPLLSLRGLTFLNQAPIVPCLLAEFLPCKCWQKERTWR